MQAIRMGCVLAVFATSGAAQVENWVEVRRIPYPDPGPGVTYLLDAEYRHLDMDGGEILAGAPEEFSNSVVGGFHEGVAQGAHAWLPGPAVQPASFGIEHSGRAVAVDGHRGVVGAPFGWDLAIEGQLYLVDLQTDSFQQIVPWPGFAGGTCSSQHFFGRALDARDGVVLVGSDTRNCVDAYVTDPGFLIDTATGQVVQQYLLPPALDAQGDITMDGDVALGIDRAFILGEDGGVFGLHAFDRWTGAYEGFHALGATAPGRVEAGGGFVVVEQVGAGPQPSLAVHDEATLTLQRVIDDDGSGLLTGIGHFDVEGARVLVATDVGATLVDLTSGDVLAALPVDDPGTATSEVALDGELASLIRIGGFAPWPGSNSEFTEIIVFGAPAGAPITQIGPALAGTGGVAPRFELDSLLEPGSAGTWRLLDAAPGAPAFLLLGSPLVAPLFGGVLGPHPDSLIDLTVDAGGEVLVPFSLPALLPPGLPFALQSWVLDPGGVAGWASTRSVLLHVQ